MIDTVQNTKFAKANLHTLRPRFRYHVAALAVLAFATFSWVGFFDIRHERGTGGFVSGIVAVVVALRVSAQSAWPIEGLKQGQEVAVLYETLDPGISMLLRGFFFYSFSSEDQNLPSLS